MFSIRLKCGPFSLLIFTLMYCCIIVILDIGAIMWSKCRFSKVFFSNLNSSINCGTMILQNVCN